MKRKLLGVTLMAALTCYPFVHHSLARPEPPKPKYTALEGCIVLGIIVVGGLTLIELCIYNNTPVTNSPPLWSNPPGPIGPPPPHGTNDEPYPWTNPPVAINAIFLTNSTALTCLNIEDRGYADTNGPFACLFTNATMFKVLAGDSPDKLLPAYYVKAWFSMAGLRQQWMDTNFQEVCTVYSPWGQTPALPIRLGSGRERQRFIAVAPQ